MNDTQQLSVSWNEYVKNVCNGLWSLQQHGEFVDMTLAADGHYVKVHKMLLSLASPYIKDLIKSTDCAHPVIFLNQVSYTTLCLLLEYIYTGEVVVPREHFKSFMEAGFALNIKGLQIKGLQQSSYYGDVFLSENQESPRATDRTSFTDNWPKQSSECSSNKSDGCIEDNDFDTTDIHEDHEQSQEETCEDMKLFQPHVVKRKKTEGPKLSASIQYSLSNQGHLQLIMNRYIYNVRYVSRRTNQRKWQCIDGHWRGLKCPAVVVTMNNTILRRSGVHNHPFHDQKILRKMQSGVIFSGINDAQREGQVVQKNKEKNISIKKSET